MKLTDEQKQTLKNVSSLDELKAAIQLIRDEYLAQHAVIKYGFFEANHASHQKVKDVSAKIDSVTSMNDIGKVIDLYMDLARSKYGVKNVYRYLNIAVKAFIENAGVNLSRNDNIRHFVCDAGF